LPANIFDYPQIVIEKQTLDVFDNPKASELVQCITDTVGRDTEYIVFGVVTEYCVRCAAKGLLERGCRVAVVKDAIETLKPEEGRRTLEELTRLGARLISTDEALQMAAATGAQKVM
jgi:nicotinamidase/pyrazinamidase